MNNANIRRLPFNEAIDFIQQKLLIPSRQYNDLIGPVHAKAFTVAGATKLQLLQDLYQAVQNSILDGTTITQFRKDFDEIVARHGWSYKGKRGWRTNVIFQTNKRTAYLAGHWAQFQRLKDRRPYLMYLTVDDSRVREEHRQWHRIVAHIDDPIWQQIFPPNGWLCRCIVRSLSQADVDRMGITVERLGRIETIDFTDPKTGEIIKKTPGIDVGWDYNVGESWLGPDAALGRQLIDLPTDLRAKALRWYDNSIYDRPFAVLTNKVAANWLFNQRQNVSRTETIGFLSEPVIRNLEQRARTPFSATLIATDKDIAKWIRGDNALPLSIAAALPQTIRTPDAVLFNNDNKTLIFARLLSDGRYAQFILTLQYKTASNSETNDLNKLLNSFKKASIVNATDLQADNLDLIQGQIQN